MSNYAKSDLIDQDYARDHFEKEPYSFKLPIAGFNLCENISGIGHGTWTVFFVEADGDETDICRVITVGELDNVLRLLKANLAAVSAIEEIRDNARLALTDWRACCTNADQWLKLDLIQRKSMRFLALSTMQPLD